MQKRPCRFCRRWFRPDSRVGKRQVACVEATCQAKRRAAAQAQWVARNPDYFRARRLRERAERWSEAPRIEAPLNELPWEMAEERFEAMGAAFLLILSRVVLRHVQDEIRLQVIDSRRDVGRHGDVRAQDERRE